MYAITILCTIYMYTACISMWMQHASSKFSHPPLKPYVTLNLALNPTVFIFFNDAAMNWIHDCVQGLNI